ncbi:yersiniabactin polyketide/non-ribosomal peptide synthetase, partial [Pseudomonas syringae pv. actinidiae ICMP 18886]
PFDASAQGTFAGNGVGAVTLRRLEDALRDGDPVLAVLRGSAINNDGHHKVGYTAPSVIGQREVIQDALLLADIDCASIGMLEAH